MKSKLFAVWLLGLAVVAGLVFLSDQSLSAKTLPEAAAVGEAKTAPAPAARVRAQVAPPELAARAFVSALILPDGRVEVLAEKNADKRWPIASITKLFTASVVARDHELSEVVTIKPEDLPEVYDSGFLKVGESFKISDLLLPLLVNSSNNAAVVLAHLYPENTFDTELNKFAHELHLKNTKLFNPSGLDPATDDGANYSTASDLVSLAKWLLANKPDLLALTRLSVAPVALADGRFHHEARSTNELLLDSYWGEKIVGGKTGQTDLAGKNLLLITKAPAVRGYLISVILGSPDHFAEMRQLIDWANQAYYL